MDSKNVVAVMLPVICERLGVQATAHVDVISSEDYDETLALCKFMSPGHYHIIHHPNAKDLITTICHELVHIVQHLRGDVFQIQLPYKDQPHEIEAYALEKELADYYRGQL